MRTEHLYKSKFANKVNLSLEEVILIQNTILIYQNTLLIILALLEVIELVKNAAAKTGKKFSFTVLKNRYE